MNARRDKRSISKNLPLIAFGPGVTHEQKGLILDVLEALVVGFHERYLGLLTIVGRNKKDMFKRIHERLDYHLHGWQNILLSKAGKTVLVKAVAQAILSYFMFVFQLPVRVCHTYQSKVPRYWWGKRDGKRSIHWCKWEVLFKNKFEGGLRFHDITVFNQALLAKTVWRISKPGRFLC